ncbi:hypothetical protein MAR_032625, partial [Mya arenaria]
MCDKSNGHCSNGCSGDVFGTMCDVKCPANCAKSDTKSSCNRGGYCKYGCLDGYEGDDCTVSATSPIGAITGVVTIVVLIGVVVAIYCLRGRFVRLLSSSKTNGNTNTSFVPDITVEKNNDSNELIEWNNRNLTESQQPSDRQPASKSSSLIQPATSHEADLETNKNAIQDEESTPYVLYTNSVAQQKPKVAVDALVQYVDSLSKDDKIIKAMFEKFAQGLIKPYVHSQRSENLPRNRYKGIYPCM